MRLLYRQHDSGGRLLLPDEFARQRGFEPAGFNMYVGITPEFVERSPVLLPSHQGELRAALDWLKSSGQRSKRVNISLAPLFPVDLAHSERCYALVDEERCLLQIERLARELAAYQKEARGFGKTLDIVVRYASEMHDPATLRQPYGRPVGEDGQGLPWGVHARAFQKSFVGVAARFARMGIRVSFSPALRADIQGADYARIRDYWPEGVKALSATWYVGSAGDFEGAVETLDRFLRDYRGRLPFGLDEIGGAEVSGGPGSDKVLRPMWETALARKVDSLSFFLLERWGDPQVTLDFLRGTPPTVGYQPLCG